MKVISRKYISSGLPVQFTAVWWLLFDRFNIAGWGWGVFWTLITLIWISTITTIVKQNYGVPVFEKIGNFDV